MVKEVPEVVFARFPVPPNELRCPKPLVERLVPDLLHALRLQPAFTDSRVDAVEEELSLKPLRVFPGECLGDERPHIVADEAEAFDLECVNDALHILDHIVEETAGRVGQVRLAGIPEPTQVRDYDVEVLGERENVLPVDVPELGLTMQEHQR